MEWMCFSVNAILNADNIFEMLKMLQVFRPKFIEWFFNKNLYNIEICI